MAVDGVESNVRFVGGAATDGFALTKVTPLLNPGAHTVALRCLESTADLKIDNPTIAVIGVNPNEG
jgi:hypothetical protein